MYPVHVQHVQLPYPSVYVEARTVVVATALRELARQSLRNPAGTEQLNLDLQTRELETLARENP